MRKIFDDTEFIERGEITIPARWQRNELKMKTTANIFGYDTKTIEKDYVSFEYNGIQIQYSCEADEHMICNKVNAICDIIDAEGTDGLTARGITWSKA